MTMTAIAPHQPTGNPVGPQTIAVEMTATPIVLVINLPHNPSARAHAPTRATPQPENRTGAWPVHQKPTLVPDGRHLTSSDRRHPCLAHQLGRRHISPKEPTRLKAHLVLGSPQPAAGPSVSASTEPAPPDTDEGIDSHE
ncbi:hypothetical protein NONI108955_01095 [Nocardia ninae]|uniref:Uncharacterized protein n=1 Tax=Nocardia ninae NBRC 108245 TaxID=1210091 RepID=A0A511MBY1_9NOCA|nr:hypothetical protein [Nocardia ninae]GEM38173.1 hypothetical protein NN4_26920 [Nocardia ninae NBRC 108245]